MSTLVLVGPPGAGKSTIGRRLARALNQEFTDTDELIAQQFGKTCGEVFAELGEPRFREIEEEVVAKAVRGGGVVSLGGGAVLSPRTRELLRDYEVVWLDVSVVEGLRRTQDNSRPVLQAEDPEARYREILTTREPLYREVASYRAKTSSTTPQKVVTEILTHLEEQ
ncbi:shikimate kinase [Corynebacterium hindlerae]|uniref:Shikimate kinase n=1 Tax=Corynebacterium hindlerae TaxID=699041 RepID=A0A7G5FFK9_9CORY|nr:shikimate kinase [Corynebacterium hindlerae]QMV85400.1 shikimate kinase [Corynebacterium hindlerae]